MGLWSSTSVNMCKRVLHNTIISDTETLFPYTSFSDFFLLLETRSVVCVCVCVCVCSNIFFSGLLCVLNSGEELGEGYQIKTSVPHLKPQTRISLTHTHTHTHNGRTRLGTELSLWKNWFFLVNGFFNPLFRARQAQAEENRGNQTVIKNLSNR